MQPYEIIAAPMKAYLAPVGEAFPDVGAIPAGNWVLIGANGDRNITEDGVTVQHSQTIEQFRTVGSTGPVKASRTEENLMIRFVLWDLTLEAYKHAMNLATVTEVAAASGAGGYKSIPLQRGLTIQERTLLVRGLSPYGPDWNLDYRVPRVIHSGEPEVVFSKGEPAGLLFEFMALEDPNATDARERFGTLRAQNAAAL